MVEYYASSIPEFDPNNYYDSLIMREMMPKIGTEIKLN